jgi:hypothetical protein
VERHDGLEDAVSRVTKAMKACRRAPRRWRRVRARATHAGGRTVVYRSGRLSLNGVPLGTITDVTIDFGTGYRDLPMDMVKVGYTVRGTARFTKGDAP